MPIALMSTTGALTMREQNVEIVDHHVIHHVNIEAARRENAEAMHLEIQRMIHYRHDRDGSGIETLEVPHLKNTPAARGRGNQLIGLGLGCGHRLFDDAHRCQVP